MSDDKTLKNMPVRSTRFTAVVSVTMVLLLLGVLGIAATGVNTAVRQVKESMGFVIVLKTDSTHTDASILVDKIKDNAYVQTITYVSAQQVLDRWQNLVGTDEDILALLDGENPFAPEIDVKVKNKYASNDSLEKIVSHIEKLPGVDNVRVSSDIIKNVQNTVSNLMIVLGGASVLLLIISIILINNTVRLTIFARRHTIYTMQLVGATASFIRRPVVAEKIFDGFIAGLLGAAILFALQMWGETNLGTLRAVFAPKHTWYVLAMMPLVGMFLCGLTSWCAVDKYIRRSQDEL